MVVVTEQPRPQLLSGEGGRCQAHPGWSIVFVDREPARLGLRVDQRPPTHLPAGEDSEVGEPKVGDKTAAAGTAEGLARRAVRAAAS